MSLELNSCVLIDYRLWAAKSEGRQWVEHCIEQCIEHPPEPRSGLCPELLADFRIPKPPGRSQGAQRAVFCAVRVADFLAEGAGWGASPGRGGELGCLRAEKKGNNKSLSDQLEGRAPFRASNSPSSPVASNPKATLKKQERAIPRRGRSVRQGLKKIVRFASAFPSPPFRSSGFAWRGGLGSMDSTLTPGHPEPFESQGTRAAKWWT